MFEERNAFTVRADDGSSFPWFSLHLYRTTRQLVQKTAIFAGLFLCASAEKWEYVARIKLLSQKLLPRNIINRRRNQRTQNI